MQSDMHYYGTYALARTAGIKRNVARVIASAAEYVDDAIIDNNVQMEDGRHMLPEVTAHKSIDYKNADADDQRRVWLPFHFLPGGQGRTIDEKLVCRKDSPIAKEVVSRNLDVAGGAAYGPHLVGITAHVYADTFAHYGFIGANHPHNAVRDGSLKTTTESDEIKDYIWSKAKSMFSNILASAISDAFPLGHGSVATFPDRPYLRWEYRREHSGDHVSRDNRRDFLQGSKALHEMFQRYAAANPGLADAAAFRPWNDLSPVVKGILAIEADKAGRTKAWKEAMRAGQLAPMPESIPAYLGEKWTSDVEEWHFRPSRAPAVGELVKSDVHLFYRAARTHRNMVITDLLPEKGILAA